MDGALKAYKFFRKAEDFRLPLPAPLKKSTILLLRPEDARDEGRLGAADCLRFKQVG